VFQFLSPIDLLLGVSLINKHFRSLTSDDSLWKGSFQKHLGVTIESIQACLKPDVIKDQTLLDYFKFLYQQVPQRLNNLPGQLQVSSTDGGLYHPSYKLDSLLQDSPECYCTQKGLSTNINVVITSKKPILITSLFVQAPGMTHFSPLGTALAFASIEEPQLKDYQDYNDCTLERYKALNETHPAIKTLAFIECPLNNGFCFSSCEGWSSLLTATGFKRQVGRHVLLKMLAPHKDRTETTIDVRYVGIQGIFLSANDECEQKEEYTSFRSMFDDE